MPQFLNSIAVLGRPGFWLGVTAGILLFALIIPTTVRQLWWLLESERVIEETADPVLVDFVGPGEPSTPRDIWEAGQTVYVRREVCIWKIVPGQIEREIVDTARLPLDVIPLGTLLYREDKDFRQDGKPNAPPWCGSRTVPATIPAFMAPGPAILRSRAVAALNPAKPYVLIPLRPAPFTINTTPTRSAIRESVLLTESVQRELDRKYRLLALKLDLLTERLNRGLGDLESLGTQYRQLYRYLQDTRVLPAPPAKPK